MEKVTITITPDGWTEAVESGGKTVEHRHVMMPTGGSRGEQKCDWLESLKDDEDLAKALDDLSFGPFGIACVLRDRAEDGCE